MGDVGEEYGVGPPSRESIRDDISIRTQDNIFDDNDKCLIDNPFFRLQPDQVETTVKRFVQEYGLSKQQGVFIKAGKILRDPEVWRRVPNLTEEEIAALEDEPLNGFWKQPKVLKVTVISLCVAAVVQGWNQTAANGANLGWPYQLGLRHLNACDPAGSDAWIFAIVNAASYLSASLVGCWISDPLNEYFYGRRSAIFISAVIILCSMIGSACSQSWPQLLACRVLLGIGMGCKAAVVPVFGAEVSPTNIRGSVVMNWQVFDAFGIFLGFTSNLAVSKVKDGNAWRWQMASSCLPTIVLLTLVYVGSESPRFIMTRGRHRYHDAYKTLVELRGEPILAAKELLYVHFQMQIERRYFSRSIPNRQARPDAQHQRGGGGEDIPRTQSHSPTINYWQKLGQLFTVKRIRRATGAAVVVMISQQLCGVNLLALFSSTLFCDADASNDPSLLLQPSLKPLFLSWGIGLVNFLFAFPAYWLIDSRGRRWLVLVALPFMALSMLAAALSFKIPRESNAHAPVIGVFTYIFMGFYSFSLGPVPFTLSAEVFPLENRMVGMSFAVFTNMLGLGLITLFVPILTVDIGHGGLLGIFSGLNVVAFILVFFFVRETSGAALGRMPGSMAHLSLEELDYLFGVPTKKYARYQANTVLPWVWKHYVTRDESCPDELEKLYTWADSHSSETEMANN